MWLIILGFYCEFYCSTALHITDLSDLLLCLQQNYGPTEIVVIIFPSNTPKIWRERWSSTSGDHHYYSSWFPLWKIISFSSLVPFIPQHQALEANANTLTFSTGKFRGKARTNLMWRVFRYGGCKKQVRSDAVLGWEKKTTDLHGKRTTVKVGMSSDSICLGTLKDIWEESGQRTKLEGVLQFFTGVFLN